MGVFGAPEGAYWLFNFHHVFLLDEEYVWAFQKAVRKKKRKKPSESGSLDGSRRDFQTFQHAVCALQGGLLCPCRRS